MPQQSPEKQPSVPSVYAAIVHHSHQRDLCMSVSGQSGESGGSRGGSLPLLAIKRPYCRPCSCARASSSSAPPSLHLTLTSRRCVQDRLGQDRSSVERGRKRFACHP